VKPRKNSKRGVRRPELRDRPMTLGNALDELMDNIKCDCPRERREIIALRKRLTIALVQDMIKGPGPSKNECEQMVFGKRVPDPHHPEDEGLGSWEIPDELMKKFPETAKVINDFLN